MDTILSGIEDIPQPPRDLMCGINFSLYEKTNAKRSLRSNHTWGIKIARLDLYIATGRDGFTPEQLRAVRINAQVMILNLIMWCEMLPKYLMNARTILIPKKPDAVDPDDFKPITISPYSDQEY